MGAVEGVPGADPRGLTGAGRRNRVPENPGVGITSRTVHDLLAAQLLQEFGWRVTIEADDDSGVWAALPVPGREEHWLRFRSESNSIEVSYWDAATPPKPAEQLFVFEPEELGDAVSEGVVLFLRALTTDEVVVTRDQSGCVASLLGAPASGGLRFMRQAEILRAGIAKGGIVYTWSQSDQGL